MKIALIAQEYYPESARGGIGTQTFMKAHGLTKLGHTIYVIARSNTKKRFEIVEDNVTVICIPGMEKQIPEMTDIVQWITHSIVVSAEIESLHQRVKLDLLDFPEWGAEGYAYLLNRTPWKTVPAVIQLHGPLVMLSQTIGWPATDSNFFRIGIQMESTCIRLADAIYSSSQCSANWICSSYEYSKERVSIIHLGIDTKMFHPKPKINKESLSILFIGKVVTNKGVEELLEAVSMLHAEFPGIQLNICGRGEVDYINKMKNRARELGIGNSVEFMGFINKADLPDIFSKADVFAAPSYYEGGPGFVYLEAMSCGLPVIGCSGSGIEEIIINKETGLLVPPKDSQKLALVLKIVLKDRELARSLGTNARNYVVKECDSETCIRKLEDFYYSAISKINSNVKSIQ